MGANVHSQNPYLLNALQIIYTHINIYTHILLPTPHYFSLSQDMPLSKIKGLGGKLGAKLTEGLGANTAGEVAAAPWSTLVKLLEERARWGAFAARFNGCGRASCMGF